MSKDFPQAAWDQRAWAVFERALDDAIASERGDVATLELGVRVAEMLMNNRIVAPPRSDRTRDGSSGTGTGRLAAPAPLELHVHAAADTSTVAALMAEAVASIEIEYGCPVPVVPVQPDAALAAGGYRLYSFGDIVALGTFDHSDRIPASLVEAVIRVLPDLLDREVAAELLNDARRHSPMVVQELVPNILALGQVRQVLQKLLRERVPIRQMSTILNALADACIYTKDTSALADQARTALAHTISQRNARGNTLSVLELSPATTGMIEAGIQLNETGQVLVLNSSDTASFLGRVDDALHRHDMANPLVVAAPKTRRHVHALLLRAHPAATVMTGSEVAPNYEVCVLDVIDVPIAEQSEVPESKGPAVTGGSWLGTRAGQAAAEACISTRGNEDQRVRRYGLQIGW